MLTREVDVVVLGVGSAGSRAARVAAEAGARTVAIEAGARLGGLCILRGCMPTKTLLETAHRLFDIGEAGRFGIRAERPTLDFAAMMERTHQLVARFQRAKVASIESGPYELVRGAPRFVSTKAVEVEDTRFVAKAFVIATGSKPHPLPHEFDVRVLTSDDVFELEAPPKRVAVIGGGAVGVELATWFARIGTTTSLVNRSALLHRSDPELGRELARALEHEMDLLVPAEIVAARPDGDESIVTFADPQGGLHERRVDFVLNATGRVPDFDGLDIERLAPDFESDRRPLVDATFRTALPHVFLAGDVSGVHGILHEANREGEVAGRNAARVAGRLDGPLESLDERVPKMSVIFSDPPYATVGLSPSDCDRHGIPYRAADKRFAEQGRGIVHGAQFGAMRLVVHAEDRRVLGCQILGPRADDLIHVPAAMMSMQGTVDDLYRVPWYHPTLAEAFVEVCRALR
ncbi:MAG: FAD-dependent oxidoreductase [Planctomycetes bacterium]|nr:FAD-dependent oxidoreductase [Planctomycetota bacterium]MCB9890346.1 FAD-dependent oxidoreductase [Planctomycetota bacterium]MCB9918164.1 FAD-dependent oxidoreductase [Planctomycetota bacterium]